MSTRWKRIAGACFVVFAAAQLIRPERGNPPTDSSRAIQADAGSANGLVAVLDRACRDCHSNNTVWPWYTRVAPVSWLMARGVKEGRGVVNFSEWAAYRPEERQALLAMSCQDARIGRMPGPWTLLHPEAKLSPGDIDTICAAAGQADSAVARAR